MTDTTVAQQGNQIETDKYTKQLHMMEDAATHLVNAAVVLTNEIKSSKTNTKKSFYAKKFSKVKNDLTQTLAAIEILKQLTGAKNASPTEPTAS